MTNDPLQHLLDQADAGAPQPPALPADFAPTLRRRATRRQHRRLLLSATTLTAAALTGAALLTAYTLSPTKHQDPPAPIATTHPAAPLAPPIATATYTYDPLQSARDDAACTMVTIAQHRARTVGPHEAAALYHRTITLFPESPWAHRAKQELANLSVQ